MYRSKHEPVFDRGVHLSFIFRLKIVDLEKKLIADQSDCTPYTLQSVINHHRRQFISLV